MAYDKIIRLKKYFVKALNLQIKNSANHKKRYNKGNIYLIQILNKLNFK